VYEIDDNAYRHLQKHLHAAYAVDFPAIDAVPPSVRPEDQDLGAVADKLDKIAAEMPTDLPRHTIRLGAILLRHSVLRSSVPPEEEKDD
jgi:hypothetical protein